MIKKLLKFVVLVIFVAGVAGAQPYCNASLGIGHFLDLS